MNQLATTLDQMSFVQLVLAFIFVTSYALAIGGLFETVGRRRAGLAACAGALGFAAMTRPWMHGALLLIVAVAGIGLFIIAVWMLSKLAGTSRGAQGPASSDRAEAAPALRDEAQRGPEVRLLSGIAAPATCREGAHSV